MNKIYTKKNANELEEIITTTTTKIINKTFLTQELVLAKTDFDMATSDLEIAKNKIKEIEEILKQFDKNK